MMYAVLYNRNNYENSIANIYYMFSECYSHIYALTTKSLPQIIMI